MHIERKKRVEVARAFGRAVRRLRKQNTGKSQERFARDAGIDRTFQSALERGIRLPTLSTILKVASGLKISPHYLVKVAVYELFRRQKTEKSQTK
jgi:transcriptional regulator with XRE-family HTH domain